MGRIADIIKKIVGEDDAGAYLGKANEAELAIKSAIAKLGRELVYELDHDSYSLEGESIGVKELLRRLNEA